MKLCIISDTHGRHKEITNHLPDADVIIHCGDFSGRGTENEIRDFLKWYSKLDKYQYKIFIAGNHEKLFEDSGYFARTLVPKNVIYLQDSGIEIEGLYFYGSPVQLPFNNWAFNKSEEKLNQHWEAIPDNVDVLITHTPPYNILDNVSGENKHFGSMTLYKHVLERIKPRINCFGHIHSSHGIKKLNGTIFINASNLDEDYNYIYKPILIEI